MIHNEKYMYRSFLPENIWFVSLFVYQINSILYNNVEIRKVFSFYSYVDSYYFFLVWYRRISISHVTRKLLCGVGKRESKLWSVYSLHMQT